MLFKESSQSTITPNLARYTMKLMKITTQATVNPAINLDDNDKNQYKNEWRTHCEMVARPKKKIGHSLSMVRGQCAQILMDKMKHDPDWDTESTSYDPLKFMALI